MGLILAFVGASQLRQFGAQVSVADLVGFGMGRDGGHVDRQYQGGRTGAAFAAQRGTTTVNGEIAAFPGWRFNLCSSWHFCGCWRWW